MSDPIAGADGREFQPPACQTACPVGTDVPSYAAFVWEGRFDQAIEAITATNPFSAICGRVCDAPCECACRRGAADGAVAIRGLKRFVLDRLGASYRLPPVPVSRSETIGIVGAGPAGLTAAHDLACAGFRVDVYEATDRPGGMMVWGIPRFRLPEGVIAQDIDRLLAHCPGITLHANQALGRDFTLAELKSRHDAVLLAIGLSKGKPLGIPGDGLPGVVDGVSLLARVNRGERPQLPASVLVVGGGDVAMDAARTARRMPGVESVRIVYRRTLDELPARRDEVQSALAEGIEFVCQVQPVAVAAEGEGGLTLRCVKTEPGEREGDGRRRPQPVPGSEHALSAGLVIAAVGQEAHNAELANLRLLNGGRVTADASSLRTADPKVLAAGDGACGGSSIVEAMHQGHKAAYMIGAMLDGCADPAPYRTPYRNRHVAVAQAPAWESTPRQEPAFRGLGTDPSTFTEVEATFDEETARREASRCFRCDAETGSANTSLRAREGVMAMAHTPTGDAAAQSMLLRRRLGAARPVRRQDLAATLDDLVFLPANLTRLVIDPYREQCGTAIRLGGAVALGTPFIVSGFDGAPESVRAALGRALAEAGSAYLGRQALGEAPWLQIVGADDTPEPAASLWIFTQTDRAAAVKSSGRPVGLLASADTLNDTIEAAVECAADLILIDAAGASVDPRAELTHPPAISLLKDTVDRLLRHRRLGAIDLVFHGGVRTGSDGAKLIALGASAVALGVAAHIAAGTRLEDANPFADGTEPADASAAAVASLIRALTAEASMMARCCGKTKLHNLEPEDLRALSVPASVATGVPLPGRGVTGDLATTAGAPMSANAGGIAAELRI